MSRIRAHGPRVGASGRVTKTLRRFEKEAFLHPENEPSLHKYGSFGHMLRLGEGVYAWR